MHLAEMQEQQQKLKNAEAVIAQKTEEIAKKNYEIKHLSTLADAAPALQTHQTSEIPWPYLRALSLVGVGALALGYFVRGAISARHRELARRCKALSKQVVAEKRANQQQELALRTDLQAAKKDLLEARAAARALTTELQLKIEEMKEATAANQRNMQNVKVVSADLQTARSIIQQRDDTIQELRKDSEDNAKKAPLTTWLKRKVEEMQEAAAANQRNEQRIKDEAQVVCCIWACLVWNLCAFAVLVSLDLGLVSDEPAVRFLLLPSWPAEWAFQRLRDYIKAARVVLQAILTPPKMLMDTHCAAKSEH